MSRRRTYVRGHKGIINALRLLYHKRSPKSTSLPDFTLHQSNLAERARPSACRRARNFSDAGLRMLVSGVTVHQNEDSRRTFNSRWTGTSRTARRSYLSRSSRKHFKTGTSWNTMCLKRLKPTMHRRLKTICTLSSDKQNAAESKYKLDPTAY